MDFLGESKKFLPISEKPLQLTTVKNLPTTSTINYLVLKPIFAILTPWQKGLVEKIENILNNMQRKILNYKTSNQV